MQQWIFHAESSSGVYVDAYPSLCYNNYDDKVQMQLENDGCYWRYQTFQIIACFILSTTLQCFGTIAFPHVCKSHRKKCSSKFHFKYMDLKKLQKPGRKERMQEDYPTSAKKFTACRSRVYKRYTAAWCRVYPTSAVYFLQMSGSLLAFLHSAADVG